MTLLAIFQLAVGFALLSAGGHYLVESATRIALLARVSTAVIGLTVVAMGTSMPELAVSLGAALRNEPDLAYSNIVGSNIFNIAMILAATALIKPIPVTRYTIKLEYPFMVLACWIMLLLSRDGIVDRLEGAFFLFALIAFTTYMVRLARTEVPMDEAEQLEGAIRNTKEIGDSDTMRWGKYILMATIGIAGLAAGAELMVRGASTIAATFGVPQRIIGLTILAMGTSLPELATSVVAARRGDSAIALGNVVGSNIFNVLAILGATSLVIPVPVNPEAIRVDNWVMLGIVVGLFPLMVFGKSVTRRDAGLLLAVFVTYMIFLFRSF
jgi:cation:H+ antiporter